ncbi:MAG: GIY-YIG nuclease family protein [bacterium]|nr:GIY-YIG nuclease family protein [bacterium]
MDKRKELKDQYKQRVIRGGVYRIVNTVNGKYILGHAVDLKAALNRFDFAVANNSCIHYDLQEDWKEFGARAFAFEVLEEIDKKQDQSQKEFKEDLETLEELWREKLDAAKEY